MGRPIGPFQLDFSVWLRVGPKETNKTLAPIGLGLFCQLLTMSKLLLINLIPLYKYNCTLGLINKLYPKTVLYMQSLHKIFVKIQSHECRLSL